MIHNGSFWCALMKMKRFSVSLAEDDYKKLSDLAKGPNHKLPIQFVAQYAITQFLKDKKNCRFVPSWEPSTGKEKKNEN
jgi:hypothetical protein